jgi:hypothetical protein
MPDLVLRVRVAVARRTGQQRGPHEQLEQIVIVGGRGHADGRSLLDELLAETCSRCAVGDVTGVAGDVEGVLVRLERDGVQGVPAVAIEVRSFGDGTMKASARPSSAMDGSAVRNSAQDAMTLHCV